MNGSCQRSHPATGWRLLTPLLFLLLLLSFAPGARAGEADHGLRIGLEALPVTADPHRFFTQTSRTLSAHLFESLTALAPDDRPLPALATGWQKLSDTLWRFHLRHDVAFHQGGRFDATDVAYSFCRLSGVVGTRVPLVGRVRAVEVEAPDRILLHLSLPDPLLPENLATIFIMDAPPGWDGHYQEGTCDQPVGDAADAAGDPASINGTGPYRLTAFRAGEQALLRRFEGYWGTKPAWSRVELRRMDETTDRNRALMSGDIDLVNAVMPQSLAHFTDRPDIKLVYGLLQRSWLLLLNQRPSAMPGGKGNPFADRQVRRAALLAIDRSMLAERLMIPRAEPGWQMVPSGHAGFQPDLPRQPMDLKAAAALMGRAGLQAGLDVTLDVPEMAEKLGQVVARSLTQVGIRTVLRVNSLTANHDRARLGDFQLMLVSVNMLSSDYTGLMRSLLASHRLGAGYAMLNYGGYENPVMDGLVTQAMKLPPDDPQLPGLYRQAAQLEQRDIPLIPLVHTGRVWAMRAGLDFPGRRDGLTLAMDVKPTGK